MKNFKRVLSVVMFAMLACVGLLFGCGDKYANLKVTTDLEGNSITLFLGEDTENDTKSVATFVATVSGVGEGVSTNLKYSFSKDNLVSVQKVESENTTEFTITALDTGSTVMTLMTEEGRKTTKVNIIIEKSLKTLTLNSSYKPYVLAGGSVVLDTPNAVVYDPADTTQKAVEYTMVGSYDGVTVEPNGLITASEDAQSGTFKVIATSKANSQISTQEFEVVVFKPITADDVTIKINGEETDLILATEIFREDASKIITLEIDTSESYKILHRVESSVANFVLIEQSEENKFDITGLNAGKGKLVFDIVLTSGGNQYSGTTLSVEKEVVVKQYATNIAINGSTQPVVEAIYDNYQNQLGKELKIVVGEENAEDKRFIVNVDQEYRNKITIVNANDQPIKIYNESGEYDIFSNHTTLFVKVNSTYQINGESDIAEITFMSAGTMELVGKKTENKISLMLKHGVTDIKVQNEKVDENIFMFAGKTTAITVAIASNEYTSFIKATANNNNLDIAEVVNYKDATIKEGKVYFEFTAVSIKEGLSTIEFFAENGMYITCSVLICEEINLFNITSQTVEENNFVGEIKYDAVVETVDGVQTSITTLSHIAIANGGVVKLSINPMFYDGRRAYTKNSSFAHIEFSQNEFVSVSENGTLIAQKLTEEPTEITVTMSIYTMDGLVELPRQTISIVVYTAIKSVELNSTYIELLTEDDLGEFDKDKSKWTFEVFVNPSTEQIDASTLTWSKSGSNESSIVLENNVVVAKNLPATYNTGSAVITGIFTQYGRTFILQATIKIVRAVRVENIYNLTYEKDQKTQMINKQNVEIPTSNNGDATEVQEVYYLYLDARDGIGENSNFKISQTVYPSNAYNKQIIYRTENAAQSGDLDVLSITEDGIVTVNRAGTAWIYIYASDSANADGTYDIYRKIYVKVADGLSSLTSLEISSANDFVSINSNLESLQKFYQITKDINLANYISKNGWTPIGLIDGQIYEFNGNINGRIISKGEIYTNTVSGIKFIGETNQKQNFYGLFAKLSESAEIKNVNFSVERLSLNFTASDSETSLAFGVIAGVNNGTLKNVSVSIIDTNSQIVDATYLSDIGGLVGINNGHINGCYIDGNLTVEKRDCLSTAKTNVGGLVGTNNMHMDGESNLVNNENFDDDYNSLISLNCHYINSNSNLPSYSEFVGNITVGGVVGQNLGTTKNSSFEGSIKAVYNVGGIVGLNNGILQNCYGSGHVEGYENVGGIAGTSMAEITFCAVNMFDENDVDYEGEITSNLIAHNNNLGGIVGKIENATISNSYVKTYFVRTTSNYVADIYITNTNSQANVGGLVGQATDVTIQKSFAEANIKSQNNVNAVVGGLVGEANKVAVNNSYSRGKLSYTGTAGKIFGKAIEEVSLTNSYSTIKDEYIIDSTNAFVGSGVVNATNSYHLSPNSKTEAELKSISTYTNWSISETLGDTDWYINNDYPLLAIDGKSLGIEAPTSISVTIKNNSRITIIDGSTFIFWNNSSNSTLAIDSVLSVSILPELAGKAINMSSTNESVLQISGRNKNRLLPVSNGYTELVITSKLNNSVSTKVGVYVHNIIEKFELKDISQTSISSLVNQKKSIFVESENAKNYKIRVSTNETDKVKSQHIFVGEKSLAQDVSIAMTDKIYISSTVSISTPIQIIFTPYVEINGVKYDYNTSIAIYYTSSYGIKDFVASTNSIQLTESDFANITFTATGDDLRVDDELPNVLLNHDAKIVLSQTRVLAYNGDEIIAEIFDMSNINVDAVQSIANNKITKIVYEYKINAPKNSKGEYTISAQFSLSAEQSKEAVSTVKVVEQSLKNIGLDFYAEAQQMLQEDGTYKYTINESSSRRIIAGKTGMMRISLYPFDAEVEQVKIYADSSTEYSFNMMQVVQYSQGDTRSYLERKPYAMNTNNGLGLILYKDNSNVNYTNTTPSYDYDGYLYVNCLIPSNVKEGTIFTIYVEALLKDGSVVSRSIPLQSEIPSGLKVTYNFNNQILTEKVYVAKNVEQTLVIEATKIDIEIVNNQVKDLTLKTDGVDLQLADVQKVNGTTYLTYKFTTTADFELSATMSKVVNDQFSTFNSNTITFKAVDFVVNSIDIQNGVNEDTLACATNNSHTMKVSVNASYDDTNEDIQTNITYFEDLVSKTYKTWFAKQSATSDFANWTANGVYTNYRLDVTDAGFIRLQPTKASTGDQIFAVLGINYEKSSEYKISDELTITLPLAQITDNESIKVGSAIGINKKADGTFYQTLSTSVTTRFFNDVSATNSIPVGNLQNETENREQQDTQVGEIHFVDIMAGSEDSLMYYRLKENITLSDYTPINLVNAEFDGNGYTITIESFSQEAIDSGNLGLFAEIDENSTAKNINVTYSDIAIDYTNMLTIPEVVNFGGISALNLGVIYNCAVKNTSITLLTPANADNSVQVYAGGLTAQNQGYISFSTSYANLNLNRGYLGGLVALNTNKISNSKVVLSGISALQNNSTTELLTKTAGFVATNRGDIYGSYVEGTEKIENTERYSDSIFAFTTIGGFVNENSGSIINCYSNIKVESQTRSSGFVYYNTGSVESCYTASKMELNNTAHNPFVGVGEDGVNNSGTINDCYYLNDTFGSTTFEPATKLNSLSDKAKFEKFVFAADGSLDGTWTMSAGIPRLVDADLQILSAQNYEGITNNAYQWSFKNMELTYGQQFDGVYNPRTVSSYADLNNVFVSTDDIQNTMSDYFVVIRDIVCDDFISPLTTEQEFKGTLIGNNMSISNLYLRAENTNTNKEFGLFRSLNSAIVKDLDLQVKQCVANNISYVGILTGYINNSAISNINIQAPNVVVQGKYFVGGLAGVVENSQVTKLNITASINAGYRGTEETTAVFTNFADDGNYLFSYAGVIAGIMTGNSHITYAIVTGDSKAIGYFASAGVALVNTGSTLSLSSVEIDYEQYIRAYYVAGGLVAENRGTIERCFVAHEQSIQSGIDQTNSTGNRNLTFFAGSPKIIGGLVGFNNGGEVSYSYSKLDVVAGNLNTAVAGGLVGTIISGSINNSYASGSVVSYRIIGGLVGSVTTKYSSVIDPNNSESTSSIFNDQSIVDGEVNITNSLATNLWLTSQLDIIRSALQKGMLIGAENIGADGRQVTVENCYFNTQLTQSTLRVPDKDKISYIKGNSILDAFGVNNGVITETVFYDFLNEVPKKVAFVNQTKNFDGTGSGEINDTSICDSVSCAYNYTPISFYFIKQFDANMFAMLGQVLVDDDVVDVVGVWEIPTKTNPTQLYPTICQNLNLNASN